MSTPRHFDEQVLSVRVKAFVDDLKESVLQIYQPNEADSEVTKRVTNAVTNALQAEFASLGFIGLGNAQLITCDMPYNSHSFRPNNNSKHCAACGADYCDQHQLAKCVKCGKVI